MLKGMTPFWLSGLPGLQYMFQAPSHVATTIKGIKASIAAAVRKGSPANTMLNAASTAMENHCIAAFNFALLHLWLYLQCLAVPSNILQRLEEWTIQPHQYSDRSSSSYYYVPGSKRLLQRFDLLRALKEPAQDVVGPPGLSQD